MSNTAEITPGVRYDAVINALPRAVIVTDPFGRILLWNEPAELLFGWSDLEVLGHSILDVLAPAEDRSENSDALSRVAGGTTLTGDRVVKSRSGKPIRVRTFTQPLIGPTGEVVALVGASEDVTDLRIAERRERDLTEHFALVLEAGGLGTWRWERESGVMRWDERLEALFGLPAGTFDGRFETYVSLVHPDDRKRVLAVAESAPGAGAQYRVEHRVVWPDQSVHWIGVFGGSRHDEHGVITGTAGCVADITDRIALEVARQQLTMNAIDAAESERVHRERLEFLNTINDALSASSTVADLMSRVTAAAVPRLGDWCSIHVLPDRTATVPDVAFAHVDPDMVAYIKNLSDRVAYDPDASVGVAHVIRSGEVEFYPDITEELLTQMQASDAARHIVAELALRSVIAVPLIKRGRVLGALRFVMTGSHRRYTTDDVTLANAVASRIASSIENHRLNEQQRSIAQTFLKSLLPASIPHIPGIDLAVRYWPVGEPAEFGGIFYDVFSLEEDQTWAIVIGDTGGTGPSAAALAGLARNSIRESAWHGDGHAEVLTSLHRAVLRSDTGSSLTALFSTVDTSKSKPELIFASGGHPLPIHATAGEGRLIGTAGTTLGVLGDISVRPSSISLDIGDVVVWHTVGAAVASPPQTLDEEQFAHLVEQAVASGGTSESIADRIHIALENRLSFDLRNDDVAVLVLRVTEREAKP